MADRGVRAQDSHTAQCFESRHGATRAASLAVTFSHGSSLAGPPLSSHQQCRAQRLLRPDAAADRRTRLRSWLPVIKDWPSGHQTTDDTSALCAAITCRQAPVSGFQSRSVASAPAHEADADGQAPGARAA